VRPAPPVDAAGAVSHFRFVEMPPDGGRGGFVVATALGLRVVGFAAGVVGAAVAGSAAGSSVGSSVVSTTGWGEGSAARGFDDEPHPAARTHAATAATQRRRTLRR
jgi:hypothetical protein